MSFVDALDRALGEIDDRIGNPARKFTNLTTELGQKEKRFVEKTLPGIVKDISGAGAGALIGGTIGSFIAPGAGTAAGAGIGAKIGGGLQAKTAQDRAANRNERRARIAEAKAQTEQKRRSILAALDTRSLPRTVKAPEFRSADLTTENIATGLGSLGFNLGLRNLAD